MDRETFGAYGFLLITTILISLLIVIATPVGDIVLDDIENKFNTMAKNTGIIDQNDRYDNYGTIIVHYRYNNSAEDIKTYKSSVRMNEYCYIDYPNIIGYEPIDETNNSAQIKHQVTKTLEHIYIYYVPTTYNIDYILNGGSVDEGTTLSLQYQYGTTYKLPKTISKEGYNFVGWYSDKGLGGKQVLEITPRDYGNKIFYAKFTVL